MRPDTQAVAVGQAVETTETRRVGHDGSASVDGGPSSGSAGFSKGLLRGCVMYVNRGAAGLRSCRPISQLEPRSNYEFTHLVTARKGTERGRTSKTLAHFE